MFWSISAVLSCLFLEVATFTVECPPNVYVSDQFRVNWTWLTSESQNIVIVLNDISKAPGCPFNTTNRERAFVVEDYAKRQGDLGFYVTTTGHESKPVNSVLTRLAESNIFQSSDLTTTVTVQPTPTTRSTHFSFDTGSNVSKKDTIVYAATGGVIGGTLLLIFGLWLVLFKLAKKYKVVRLPVSGNPAIPIRNDIEPDKNVNSKQEGGSGDVGTSGLEVTPGVETGRDMELKSVRSCDNYGDTRKGKFESVI
ncbi:hypothetical protein L218DRAFT_950359 [Marasmius fiardii PR-910]|nr:hypothetical protein L218DRAFT_950359 [Marasmius fiardii PR-910]